MPKRPSAADLASLRVPADVRLSPDGRLACFVLKESAPDLAGYRQALWLVPTDGTEPPRRLTLGATTIRARAGALVARGISVFACNPRGSTGYGQALAKANFRDWGPGPQVDIEAGLDKLIAAGRIDPQRVGVTGGSYGGYLTAAADLFRYAAAVACRGLYDLVGEMTSGDLGGPVFGRYELDAQPWTDPELYRQMSPLTYADDIRTPLLIQHAEQDLRCPVTQAEQMFSVLRSMRRQVRLMRTPGESHELTRSGAPFRRIENIERISDWFVHYLVDGGRTLPRT